MSALRLPVITVSIEVSPRHGCCSGTDQAFTGGCIDRYSYLGCKSSQTYNLIISILLALAEH
jgi:hypothetical protein